MTDDPPDPRDPPDLPDPIETLARAGRRVQAREAAGADRARRGAVTAADRMAWLSATRLGWFGCYTGGLVVWLTTFGALGAALLLDGVYGDPSTGVQVLEYGAILAVPWLAVLGMRAAALAVGRARLPRELAWARALPFDLDGFEAMLRAGPPKAGTVVVRFADPAAGADLEQLRDAARGATTGDAAVRDGAVIVSSRAFSDHDDMGPTEPSTNHSYVRWLHRLVDELLAPMHARRRLGAVTVIYTGRPDASP